MITHPFARASISAVLLSLALTGCPGTTPAGDAGPGTDGALPDTGPENDTGVPPTDAAQDTGTPPTDAWSLAPAFRTPHPEIADADLAQQALRILGAPEAGATEVYCNDCHSLTRGRIRYWRSLSETSMTNCLTDLSVSSDASATSMLTCLGSGDPAAIAAADLGIWSTAAGLAWFTYVFDHGIATDPTGAHTAFVENAGMPEISGGHTAMTQEQFDIVAEWFLRGIPEMDSILPADTRPTECLPGVSDAVRTHVSLMETTGWAARNRTAGILPYGCAGAASALDCLAAEPLASATSIPSAATWDAIPAGGVSGAHLRVLYTTAYRSAYWTRSSVDGRFVSHGAATSPNLRFIDLQTDRVIGGNADYDPFFFPDDSGFIVQGGSARICENHVLTTGSPTMLSFTETGCSSGTGIGLYEHAGTSLDGGDYWAIDSVTGGMFAVYDHGDGPDPIADFPSGSMADITLMTNDGTRFVVNGHASVATPYEGDHVISPGLGVLLTRVAGAGDRQIGFALHRMDVTGSGASLSIATPEIARYCINGGKPGFSYDERFFVLHHYVDDGDAVELGFTGPTDPGFAAYRTQGAANIYLVDMVTGAEYRLTNMAPGQRALFPHFRTDGWIYFMVRTGGATAEHVVASDAALLIAP